MLIFKKIKIITIVFSKKIKMRKLNKTCSNCLQKTKVALVDLNLYNGRGGRIKYKRCKRNKYCLTIILDKIVINMKNLNDNLVKN